jgi:hypothetical protein
MVAFDGKRGPCLAETKERFMDRQFEFRLKTGNILVGETRRQKRKLSAEDIVEDIQ